MLTWIMSLLSLTVFCQENRSYDGKGNNLNEPLWGAAHAELTVKVTPAFSDGFATPARDNGVNPRTISNKIFDQSNEIRDQLGLSDFIWVFGQFIDHDITLVENYPFSQTTEAYNIQVRIMTHSLTMEKSYP